VIALIKNGGKARTGIRSMLLPIVILILAGLTGCASRPPWNFGEPPKTMADDQPYAERPEERDPSLYWDAINQSSFYLMENSLDLPRQYRKLFGRELEAYNVDQFGRMPNSTWFTDRRSENRPSAEQLRRGPNTISGPDASGPWTITRAKTQGVTPGFFVRDPAGETFILKFDPQDYPELATGAEMVSTMLFYAFGYNLPENYLVTFDPAILHIKDGLTAKDAKGVPQPFTQGLLDSMLAKVARRSDGTIRAIASRFLPGQPLGPFSYKGTRDDDPNDVIPHQHRRELRALKIFAELTNHFDTKDHNSLDIWVDSPDGGGYVRHYLIDFGSTLGSDGDEPKAQYKGYAYALDLEQALVSLFTLGLRKWSWEDASMEGIPPEIGYFESERFHPPGWKPLHGNPAFDNMTHNDAYWAVRILASFTEEDLRACVAAGEYSDPAAAEYLVKTLQERQRKIIDYYYEKVNPLDDFRLESEGGGLALHFQDYWVNDGVGTVGQTSHRFRFGHQRDSWEDYRSLQAYGPIEFDIATLTRMSEIAGKAKKTDDKVFNVQIQSLRAAKWARWVRVYIYFDGDPAQARIIGIERDD